MTRLERALTGRYTDFYPVVEFDNMKDKLVKFDLSKTSISLTKEDIADTGKFSRYVEDRLNDTQSRYGIGGYNEDRVLYQRSSLFDGTEPRTIHLGIDIWGPVGTKVYTPLGGMVHSFAFNNDLGDYGATIILLHQLDTVSFYTLYGHVCLADLEGLQEGKYVNRGELLAHFGKADENGDWPPHLHFQIIEDMEMKEGDYPGVCAISERERYLNNCPDPDLILGMKRYAQ